MAAKGFVSKHPWMTFFLALAGLGVAQVIFTRSKNATNAAPPSPAPTPPEPMPMGQQAPDGGIPHGLGIDEPPPEPAGPPTVIGGDMVPIPQGGPVGMGLIGMPLAPRALPPQTAGFHAATRGEDASGRYDHRSRLGAYEG